MAHKLYYLRQYGISKPEIILSETAHPSFTKAVEFLGGIKMVSLKVNHNTGCPDPSDYEKAITKNTVLIVCSCPSYPFGLVDPINECNILAGKYNVGLHIDCCMGGVIIGYIDELKIKTGVEFCDFRNKNCTAISFDSHKYALAPKGISCLLFSNPEMKKMLHFAQSKYMGALYTVIGIRGSRGSSMIAAAWAVMLFKGKEGYRK